MHNEERHGQECLTKVGKTCHESEKKKNRRKERSAQRILHLHECGNQSARAAAYSSQSKIAENNVKQKRLKRERETGLLCYLANATSHKIGGKRNLCCSCGEKRAKKMRT